jgi:hypothetical protein
MKQKSVISKKAIYLFIVVCLLCGTLFAEITENFRNFLYSNGELISRLAHPTNEYIDAYVDSNDYLVIASKSVFTDSRQRLKIFISQDFKTFEVISDDSFVPAFAAIGLIKDLLIDIIKDFSEDSTHSEEQNQFVRTVLDKIDEMDGQQLAYVIVLLKWIDY